MVTRTGSRPSSTSPYVRLKMKSYSVPPFFDMSCISPVALAYGPVPPVMARTLSFVS